MKGTIVKSKWGWFVSHRTSSHPVHPECGIPQDIAGEALTNGYADIEFDVIMGTMNDIEYATNIKLVKKDAVDVFAQMWIQKNSHKWSLNTDEVGDNYGSFVAGYNKANEVLFTEYQVREAIMMASTSDTDFLVDRCDEIIKSLKQPKQ